MDNYNLLQKLGKGAQGSVYLVEHLIDKKQYVLKKVECNDEQEANKAFKEAMALQELRHDFICGYKEFFVTWDKEEEAMFVCIVMNFYEMGDLAKVIKTKRNKNEKFDEMVLKKWLGQMLEALVFVHNKRVIHRDLKPSNIFMTKNLSISIGDFGVATVMGDARTRTRTTVGSMNWMAPEVMERPYDERSDVWSFGCILLELATCGVLDAQEVSQVLFDIKQNPQCLEDTLNRMSDNSYSPQLAQLIRDMLRRNFQQRPTAQDLVAYPYVKECLLLNPGSELVKKKKESNSSVEPLPKDCRSAEKLFAYVAKHISNAEAQLEPLKILARETSNPSFCSKIDNKMRKLIGTVMRRHVENLQVQLDGCKIVTNLIEKSPKLSGVLFERESIAAVLGAMKSDYTNKQLQLASSSLVMLLSAEESAAEKIGQLGGVQDILSLLRQFKDDADICLKCCSTLWSLCVNEKNASIVTEERGIYDVCKVIETHFNSPEVLETACSAIWSLSLEEGNADALTDVGIGLMVEAVRRHIGHGKVVKSAVMALATVVTLDEVCAFKLLAGDDEGGSGGVEAMNACYRRHKLDADIVESYTTLLVELTEYDDVLAELKAPGLKLKENVKEIAARFRSNEEIKSNVDDLAERLDFKL